MPFKFTRLSLLGTYLYKKNRKCLRKKEGKGKAIHPADGTKTLEKGSELRRWLVLAEERRHEKVRDRRISAFGRTRKPESEKNLGLVWINSPYEEEMTLLAKEALGEKVRVHIDTEPPWGEAPCCCVLICPNDDEVVSQMRHLRSQVLDLPVVVFCQGKELRLVEQALRAGASGFVHAAMRPEKIALALSLASEGEVFIPRELLEDLIGQRLFLRRPRLFDS